MLNRSELLLMMGTSVSEVRPITLISAEIRFTEKSIKRALCSEILLYAKHTWWADQLDKVDR